jgi:DNA-binding transcriptional LysR family regulator
MNTTIPNISTHQMHAVLTLQAEGTFTAAAKKLGLSQPGLTRMIQRTEKAIGKQLFERTGSGAELTEDGIFIASWATETLNEMVKAIGR